MSEYLAAAAQKLDAPEELVMRSASARADADGLPVDDVLQAWAGGTVLEAPAPSAPAAEPTSSPEADVAEPEPEPAVAETPTEVAAEPAPAPVAAAVEVIEEPDEPVEVPPLRDRLKAPLALGGLTGAVLGVVGLLLASSPLIDVAFVTTAEPPSSAVLVSPTVVIVTTAAISILFGALTAVLARNLPTFGSPGARLATGWVGALIMGAIVGAVLGAVAAALLLGVFGESVETVVGTESEVRVLLPTMAMLILVIVGGALLGALAAVTPHVLGMPAALSAEGEEEPFAIRRRLSTAFSLPVMVMVAIALLVIPFALTLLQWPRFAPVIATAVALSILGFSALARVHPGTRVRRGDVYAAISGIGVLFLVIIAVLTTWFADGDDHETEVEGESRAVVQVVG